MPFKKILVANRGEIAVRVFRTCRRMGIATVAVHSAADRDALHVRMADEAVEIGGAASADSYLRIDRVVEACRRVGADAVHPGYGFLSEKAPFAEALAAAGIAFIGPPPDAMRAMGDKIESKRLALAAGVSVVPGHVGVLDGEEAALKVAREIGYPVMIKASAGGGGKGMRIARTDAELIEGLGGAMNEARSAFADDRVFIERYVERPRHIEIQVLADAHGTTLHLGERECSLQRRHQKVIEEAPSSFLDAATRQAMGEQAVALARAVGYRSAGTVEFIVAPDRSFYFLEMNTRLQVEHPVTEYVTGLDLVEWMIRIAAGEPLAFGQDQVTLAGWAIEARVYAEDPARNFLPAVGRLTRYREPTGEGVRVDSGVYEGAEIPIHYDPMIAKLIAAGPDRATALTRLSEALDGFDIRGVAHNVAFLNALALSDPFASGDISTGTIAELFPQGFRAPPPAAAGRAELVALAAARGHLQALRDAGPGGAREDPAWVALAEGIETPVVVTAVPGGADVMVDGRTLAVRGPLDPHLALFRGEIGGRRATVRLELAGSTLRLATGGHALAVRLLRPRAAELLRLMPEKRAADLSRFLLSPMPGLLVRLAVDAGAEVKAGEPLAVVEAMKMENVLRAERDAVVKKIVARIGASLSVDEVILEFA
jgi:propionyl-CoA carboxylase alpha chain